MSILLWNLCICNQYLHKSIKTLDNFMLYLIGINHHGFSMHPRLAQLKMFTSINLSVSLQVCYSHIFYIVMFQWQCYGSSQLHKTNVSYFLANFKLQTRQLLSANNNYHQTTSAHLSTWSLEPFEHRLVTVVNETGSGFEIGFSFNKR